MAERDIQKVDATNKDLEENRHGHKIKKIKCTWISCTLVFIKNEFVVKVNTVILTVYRAGYRGICTYRPFSDKYFLSLSVYLNYCLSTH